MIYIRGQAEDYDGWLAAGNPGWGWRDVLPAFERMEGQRGDGPLHVEKSPRGVHPTCENFIEGCRQAGLLTNSDFNGPHQEGAGSYHITVKGGRRMSAARAYLRPSLNRANLHLEKNAHATRIVFDGRRAIGIDYTKGGETRSALAAKEVILSAGAINSPQLLLLSGVGPAGGLSALGIKCVLDAPAVGKNLQDHYGVDHLYGSTQPTLNDQLHPWWGKLWAGMQYVLARRGPLTRNINHAGGFFCTRPELTRPNMQLYFSPMSYQKTLPGTRQLLNPDPFSAFNMGISQCHPTSRGYLRLKSADPMVAPEIQPNYLATEHDRRENLEGVKFLRTLAATPAMKALIARELDPGPHASGDDALMDHIRQQGGTVFHPASTCRMGPDAKTNVVDAKLKVHGVEGLRVADASILPTMTAGNINAPCIMIGEKASDFVLADQ
jgi:choline dehydrogenase